MKKVICCLLIFSLSVVSSFAADEKVIFEDRVIASVDGEPIVMSDLEEFAKEQDFEIKNKQDKLKLLQDMVSLELLKKEAEKEGVSVSDEELERYINGVAEQNGLSRARFEELLKKEGLTVKKYRKQVEQDIIRTKILSLRVRSKINVLDEDVEKYLSQNKSVRPKKGQVYLYQAALKGEGAIDKIVSIRKEIKRGADFRQAAGSAFSDLGYVNPKELKEDLQKEIAKLKVGELTKIISSGDTQLFLQLRAKAGSKQEIPEDLKAKISEQLFQEQYQAKLEQYLKEELPKSYHVEVNL